MATILTKGDPLLAQTSQPVEWPDERLVEEIGMLRTALHDFRDEHGFGRAIAAPQVGISKRIVYLHVDRWQGAIINPQITWRSTEQFAVWDDCLSVPDCIVRVRRHRSISVTFRDTQGDGHQWENLPEDMSELLQHEIDHLDGVLMTDRAIDAKSIRPISERAELIDSARAINGVRLD